MKYVFTLLLVVFSAANLFAQKETFDLTTYTAPVGWKKEVNAGSYTCYTITSQQNKDYCRVFIMHSTGSKGDINEDFESEWNSLLVKQYGVIESPRITEPVAESGWKIKGGMAPFTFNNQTCTAVLTTMSGFNKVVSIVAVTNNPGYMPAIQQFLESVEMKKNATTDQTTNNSQISPARSGRFIFTTSTFDNGWTSTVQEDWVQVTKGVIKVLIHYPNRKADAYNSVLLEGLKNAWDILVAPRYNAARNFEFKPIGSWQSIEFAEADMVENATGQPVHVVLFKMNYSNGSGKYLEFITPDKRSFEQEFGAYHASSSGWEKMENMADYNKFAVATSDLQGKWTSDFSGSLQYINAYTGLDAGMDTHAAVENFNIGSGNTYTWDIAVASGQVGNIKFQSKRSSGRLTMTGNWKVSFSDIEGKPRTYNVYFSCIKGLRILWLDGKPFAKAG